MCEGRVRKGNSMTLTSHIRHMSYILARIYPNMNFETLCRVTRIFIFRVETEGFYATLVIIPGNITIEIAAECSEGERRRFCQRQTLCVYVCI